MEFVQASPAIGPWEASADRALPYLSYSVADVDDAATSLEQAGLKLAARAGNSFAYYRASGGVLVRVISRHLMPAGPGSNKAQAPIDLGPPAADALYPCDISRAHEALSRALGIEWRLPQLFALPWQLADGSIVVRAATATISQQRAPFIATEAPHGFPGEDSCSVSYTPHYLVFATPNVAAADAQMKAAGMRFIARSIVDDVAIISAYRGAGGVSLEAVSPIFVPPA